jgi:outer membrane protein insertion porin family
MADEARLSGLISAVGYGFTYDSTDSIERPTKGFKSRIEAEFAGVGGDHCFLSTAYINTLFYQVAPDGVFKLRGDFKFIQPLAYTGRFDIPLDERFFLGGDELVRGFRPYALGPVYPDTTDPRGGISLQYFSLEYDYRVIGSLDFFTFIDAGFVSLRTWDFGTLRTAVGWGIKFKAFASGPPIVFGFGYPINPRDRSDIKRFFISMGSTF